MPYSDTKSFKKNSLAGPLAGQDLRTQGRKCMGSHLPQKDLPGGGEAFWEAS